jgi:WD40 repeat protein
VPLLVDLLQHADAVPRRKAAEVFSALGAQAQAAIPALQRALTDADPLTQRWAARALGEIGPAARAALVDLVQLRSRTTDVRTAAIAAVAARRIDVEASTSGIFSSKDAQCLILAEHSWVQCVAFSRNGRFVLSGGGQPVGATAASASYGVRLWDLEAKRVKCCFAGHADQVTSLAFSADSRFCLSGSYDATVRGWDIESGRALRCLIGHEDRIRSVAVSPDGRYALSGACDQTARLWDLETGRECQRFRVDGQWVMMVAFSADGRRAFAGSKSGLILSWSVPGGRKAGGGTSGTWLGRLWPWGGRPEPGSQAAVTSLALSPDGRRALIARADRTLRLWDLEAQRDTAQFQGHTAAVMSIAFSADGRQVLSGGMDRTLRLWDVATATQLRRFDGHGDVVLSVALSVDGRFALSGSADGTVRLWPTSRTDTPTPSQ